MAHTIDKMRREDWARVREIYAGGLATGVAAFMTNAPRWAAWNAGHMTEARLVARNDEDFVVGWAALSPVPDT